MNVKLKKEQRIHVQQADDIVGIMQQILQRDTKIGRDREHFWVVGLDAAQFILFIELVSLGSTQKTLVEPVEVFSFALQKRAISMILVHSHPGIDLKPSIADENVTDRLLQVGNIVRIRILDHLIISAKTKSFFSFADEGLLEKLEDSTLYVAPYKLEKAIRKVATTEAIKKMAKGMKKKKVDVKIISQISGLTLGEIEKL